MIQTTHKKHDYIAIFKEENQSSLTRCNSEDNELIQFMIDFKSKYPDVLVWHTANEINASGARYHQRAKQKGKLNGVSDILIFHAGRFIAIELKRRSVRMSSPVSTEQVEYIRDVINNGGFGCVAYGAKCAMAAFEYFKKFIY